MKRCLIILICCFFFPLFVKASGGISLSSSSSSITVGSSSSFKVNANNAAGKVIISVDDSNIATINQGSVFLDNDSVTVKVTANNVGTTNVKVYLSDVTTYDDEDISGRTLTFKVTVKEKPVYSKNNKLKSISVDGFNLVKKDDNNYSLTVNKDTSSIKLNVSAEDSKAKVSNDGSHDLTFGENIIEVVITSESGSKNTIYVNVFRREGYALSDLKDLIDKEDIVIELDSDTIIKKSDLDLIKTNKKVVTMNYKNKDKKIIYSWIFDGNKMSDTFDINSSINVSNNNEDLSKLTNYSDSLYMDFSHSGNVVKGTTINVNVEDKFKDEDKLKLYFYDKDKKRFDLVLKEVSVKDNMVSFDIEHCSTYFLTKSIIIDMDRVDEDGNIKTSYLWIIIIGGVAFLELLFIGFMFYTYEFKKGNLI